MEWVSMLLHKFFFGREEIPLAPLVENPSRAAFLFFLWHFSDFKIFFWFLVLIANLFCSDFLDLQEGLQ